MLASLLCVAFGLAVLLFLNGNQNDPPQENEPEEVSVVVAARELPLHTWLTEEMLRVRRVNPSEVPLGAARSIEQLKDRQLRFSVVAGQVISTDVLTDAGRFESENEIPRGYRVMIIPVQDPDAPLDAIRPQDVVDVFSLLKPDTVEGDERRRTELVLPRLTVFSVENREQHLDSPETSRTISLLVKPEEAATLWTAKEDGPLTVELHGKDEEPEPSDR